MNRFVPFLFLLASLAFGERLRVDHYFTCEEMEQALKGMASAHPDMTRIESMGKSFQGRDLWMFVIANPKTGPEAEKAAMYIEGNIHGNEVQGTEICLYTIDLLLGEYGKDPYLTKLVDERVFYIAPCVNPDGRANFLAHPNTPHSSRHSMHPVDEDNDGIADEDGYVDLDGDGSIQQMRVRDPNGEYKTSPSDPRLMVPKGKFEKGEWKVYEEGMLNDRGEVSADTPGGYDMNRSFPSNWGPKAEQGGASPYPLYESETRAVATWIVAHPNISGAQDYHNNGDMILRPPMIYDDDRLPRTDIETYDALAKRGKELLPDYNYLQTFRGLYPVRGGFIDWTYTGLGVFSFTDEVWDMKLDLDGDGKVDESDWLVFNDTVMHGAWFQDWKPFDHPQLGKVELGGWSKWAFRIPPTWMLPDVCHRNCTFTLFHAESMPRVEIGEVKATAEGKVWCVRVELRNTGFLPTVSGQAEQAKIGAPDLATIEGEGLKVIAVGRVSEDGLRVTPVLHHPQRVQIGHIAGLSSERVEWEVTGATEVKVTLRSQRGGVARKTIPLK